MNWEALGAIGEIAGAIGVIVTLVYLSAQIRQNTKSSKIAAVQTAMDNSARWSELLVNDKELNDMFFRGMADPDALDMSEKRRFISTLNIYLRRESLSFYLHEEGDMPDALWEARVRGFTGILNQPGLKFVLDAVGDSLPTEFREFVESKISQNSTMTDTARSMFQIADD